MTFKAIIGAFVFSLLFAVPTSVQTNVPGWLIAGSNPTAYRTGTNLGTGPSGGRSAFLHGRPDATGFGTLMQMFSATKYEGKRVRLSADISTENLKRTAGLWMRMDGERGNALRFDNMEGRPITGTTGWTRYEVVLDAPAGTRNIAIGVLMVGGGMLWIENVKLDIVPDSIPVTGTALSDMIHTMLEDNTEPKNLDFNAR